MPAAQWHKTWHSASGITELIVHVLGTPWWIHDTYPTNKAMALPGLYFFPQSSPSNRTSSYFTPACAKMIRIDSVAPLAFQ